jgi:uncharacterized protein YecE (DUF72 family)
MPQPALPDPADRAQTAPHAYIGTSGWNYREWRPGFYPAGLSPKQWLAYYAGRFDSVEINYSFYRLPAEAACETWYSQTPGHFRFAMKASRYLTHVRRLKNVEEPWDKFVSRIEILREKLGPVLLQFPRHFDASEANLKGVEQFLRMARQRNPAQRLAFEFRENSCHGEAMCSVLKEYDAALVTAHSTRYPVAESELTASFAYFRFHGPREMFASSYSSAELADWAAQIRRLTQQGDVYAFFNNDSGGHAPPNALALKQHVYPSLPDVASDPLR